MSKWWERLGIGVSPTQGEQKMSVVGNEAWLKAQDITDARRLIESGKATGDNEMIETGKARLRFALGKQTPEDEDLFRKK